MSCSACEENAKQAAAELAKHEATQESWSEDHEYLKTTLTQSRVDLADARQEVLRLRGLLGLPAPTVTEQTGVARATELAIDAIRSARERLTDPSFRGSPTETARSHKGKRSTRALILKDPRRG